MLNELTERSGHVIFSHTPMVIGRINKDQFIFWYYNNVLAAGSLSSTSGTANFTTQKPTFGHPL